MEDQTNPGLHPLLTPVKYTGTGAQDRLPILQSCFDPELTLMEEHTIDDWDLVPLSSFLPSIFQLAHIVEQVSLLDKSVEKPPFPQNPGFPKSSTRVMISSCTNGREGTGVGDGPPHGTVALTSEEKAASFRCSLGQV
jgi:hypothetical protein